MAAAPFNEIESQFAKLPKESQLILLERLVHQLRQTSDGPPETWDAGLSAMAADPEMQRELRQIDSEFKQAEADGLGKS